MTNARHVGALALSAAITLSALFSSTKTASAQDAPIPWIQLTIVRVAPTMVDEFLSVQKEFTARAKKSKVPWRTVSRTEVFGDTYRFLIATPLETLASLDKVSDPDAELTSLINRVERCVTSRTSYAVRTLPDFSKPLPEGKRPDLMVVNFARVPAGRDQEYIDVMAQDFLPHFDEAKIHHESGAVAFGGDSGFIHVFYIPNFAELDKGSPVMRALGSDGAQRVTKKFSGLVTSSEQWVARVNPDVSFGPEPKTTEQP